LLEANLMPQQRQVDHMRCYYVELRKLGTSECELIRANGHRDARKLASSVDRHRYRARIIATKRR
jgi:hypothetical protein